MGSWGHALHVAISTHVEAQKGVSLTGLSYLIHACYGYLKVNKCMYK